MNDNYMNLPTKLKKIMRAQHWTAYKLALATNLDQSTISRILSGDCCMPTIHTLQALSETLQVSIEYLLNYDKLPVLDKQVGKEKKHLDNAFLKDPMKDHTQIFNLSKKF